MQPKRRPAAALLVAAATVLAFVGSGHAGRGPGLKPSKPPRPGDRCTHPGFSARYQGRVWSCERTGHGTVWVVSRGGGAPSGSGSGSAPSGGDLTLTALPVDLAQIQAISKFRSCSGHDFSGYDVAGQLETNRSMKHYFDPLPSLANTTGVVKVFAPAAGRITHMQGEQSGRGTQVWIGTSDIGWNVILFHLDPVPGLAVGSAVTPGQLVGYANLANAFNFDIAYQRPAIGKQAFVEDSIFEHMASDVAAAFAARGITPATIIVPQSVRDASPCTDFQDHPGDYVTLTP